MLHKENFKIKLNANECDALLYTKGFFDTQSEYFSGSEAFKMAKWLVLLGMEDVFKKIHKLEERILEKRKPQVLNLNTMNAAVLYIFLNNYPFKGDDDIYFQNVIRNVMFDLNKYFN